MAIKKKEAPSDDLLAMDLTELDQIMNLGAKEANEEDYSVISEDESNEATLPEEMAPEANEANTSSEKPIEANEANAKNASHSLPGKITKRFSGNLVQKILEGMIDEEYIQTEISQKPAPAPSGDASSSEIYLINNATGLMYSLPKGMTSTIGKDPAFASLLITDNPTISRRHAEILVDDEGGVFIKDIGSKNGTQVNGTTLDENDLYQIQNGDIVVFSDEVFTLGGGAK